jgi:CRISPR-associated endonuclease/helicase Cas3
MRSQASFDATFSALTGNAPFPWQRDLYEKFIGAKFPQSCNIPTGLGKTSVIPIWLIALANEPGKVPRRLAYIVNRRTVVDQATDEAEKMRANLNHVPRLAASLLDLCADKPSRPLAISSLRGQFADNRQWSSGQDRRQVQVISKPRGAAECYLLRSPIRQRPTRS